MGFFSEHFEPNGTVRLELDSVEGKVILTGY